MKIYLNQISKLFLIVLLLTGNLLYSKQDKPAVVVKSSVDNSKITIGDKVNYKVIIDYDSNIQVELPDIAASLSAFEIKDYKILKPKKKRGRIILENNYLITTFTTGEYVISSTTVKYFENDESKEAITAELKIYVESIKASDADKDDIRDIKFPLHIPHSILFYFLLFSLPLLMVIFFLGYHYYKNREIKGFFTKQEPSKTADEIALEQLEKLKNMNLIEEGKIKEYYIILSEIIRRYMEGRYKIEVLDRTTGELYWEMKNAKIDKKVVSQVKEFLEDCDLVKFAKYVPSSEIIEKDFDTAKNIIETTKEILTNSAQDTVHSIQ
ncbi:MAG: hypothetical protein A2539_05870 [Elusimicrobia bacterium RIFOXYD2_FULL_34_15]|nr:MAG: hypothetical protein A2539_05870 [Elusimicrobia bacterium RIFOXYD2_FULL_34_15]